MNIDLIVLLACAVSTLLLGFVILLRNPAAIINRIFAFFSVSIALWSLFNYIADHSTNGQTLLWTRLTFLAGAFIVYSGFLLSCYFPRRTGREKQAVNRALPYFMTLTALLSMTPYMVKNSVHGPHGAILTIGTLYFVFLLYVAYAVMALIRNFYVQYKTTKSVVERVQIKLVLAGILLYAFFSTAFNLIIPLFVQNWASSRYGPIFALFVVALTAYTIVKHRLLDIRLIIVRSLAYFESLFVIGLVYGFGVFFVTKVVLSINFSLKTEIIVTIMTALAALSFPYVKTRLDRWTDRFFYRDAYDAQNFFNEFNQLLIASLDLETLVVTSTKLISETLKSEFCVVVFEHGKDASHDLLGAHVEAFARKGATRFLRYKDFFQGMQPRIIMTDYMTSEHEAVRALKATNVGIAMPLEGRANESAIGYLILGNKKSGNPYSTQDGKTIEAVADGLTIAIQNALRFEEIENFNRTLQQKIDEATHKLQRTNQKLRLLDETKDDFISMASHQLRTPLTSVKGYVSMVLDGDAGSIQPLQRKLLNQAFISSQRMVYLISDLLNVSRLRTGKFVIEPMATNLAAVVKDEVEQLLETAKGRDVELTYHRPDDFPALMLDEIKMRQVIMNFLDNAIYYTPSGGRIEVRLEDKPESVSFTVVDTGMGVPRAEQHHLFSKFFRADNAKRARPDGTGLGLFMAKKVIVAQGGAIIFKSKEGEGSTFGFTFAKSKLPPLAPRN